MKTKSTGSCSTIISLKAHIFICTRQFDFSPLLHLTMMFTRLRCRLNFKLKPVVLSCPYGFRNNYMLNSVYFWWLVDLENKSCVRVPLVIILPECELNHCCRNDLKKALQMVCEQFHSNNFHKAFEGLFLRRKNIQTPHQAL